MIDRCDYDIDLQTEIHICPSTTTRRFLKLIAEQELVGNNNNHNLKSPFRDWMHQSFTLL